MTDTYECITCHKKREGRFTRPHDTAGGGWSQGHTLPHWHCWTCLPAGQGRDETEETMTKKKEAAAADFIPEGRAKNTATQESSKALSLIPTFQGDIQALVVEDDDDLQTADGLLGRIRLARKGWGLIFGRIQEKTIKPIRAGLEELYQLNRDVDGPYEKLEKAVKLKMDDYQRGKLAAARAIQDEIDRKQRQLDEAKTPQMRGRIASQIAVATEKQVEVEAPVALLSSSSRKQERARVPNMMDLIKAMARGDIPLEIPGGAGQELVTLNQRMLDAWFKVDPDTVRELAPVIEVYDDIRTVGR